ncbi:TPA: hypothetical protein MYO83_006380 [Klebsiella michiganensis]|nr:hypothetical protein [Klebsiella michiganensis]HCB1503392.1 hypothetical protein [Klebsiella michiganensis]HCB1846631.1 hypothetical protein [Klebsiella oxytoca]
MSHVEKCEPGHENEIALAEEWRSGKSGGFLGDVALVGLYDRRVLSQLALHLAGLQDLSRLG